MRTFVSQSVLIMSSLLSVLFGQPLLFLQGLGGTELILIVLVVLLLFGAKRIPELMKGLGKGIREFKEASREIQEDLESEDDRKRLNR